MLPLILFFAAGAPAAAPSLNLIPPRAIALSQSDAPSAGSDLVTWAVTPPQSPLVLETLARFYRDHPPAAKGGAYCLPDPRIQGYATSSSAEDRAAFAFLCAVLKDPAAVPALIRLAGDPDPSVRRATALALGERTAKSGGPSPRQIEEHTRCLYALRSLLLDTALPVRIAACRAVASYGAQAPSAAMEAIALLKPLLQTPDFNLKVAAIEGLTRCVPAPGKFPAQFSFPTSALLELANNDPSTSVRHSAAIAVATFSPDLAESCVARLLFSRGEYDRAAACEVLSKLATPDAWDQLATLAAHDPSFRVREEALTGLALQAAKQSAATHAAAVAALADRDPEIFAGGCSIAQADKWTELTPAIIAGLARFTGGYNADARIAALSALADLETVTPGNSAAIHTRDQTYRHDANPGVRMAALTALATLDHQPAPALSRGADLTGNLYPGGKPVFGPDVFLILETEQGRMKIRLYPDKAPVTCGHVAALARAGFYNGLTWHRVVPDFVIQGGCPRGDGCGNAGVTLPLESTDLPFERGTLGMPRDSHPDTGGCQLFICHSRAPHLDVAYCAFGQVVEGFEVIDKIDVDSHIVSARVEGLR